MAPRVAGRMDPLGEYLASLFEADSRSGQDREERLLLSYAELQFQMRGGGRCSLCNAPVRLLIPVVAEHEDGTVKSFACLCQRCLEGERDQAKVIRLQIGDAKVELLPRRRPETKGEAKRAQSA